MKPKVIIPAILVLVVLAFFAFRSLSSSLSGKKVTVTPTPDMPQVEQLPVEKQPQASLTFTSDGHYVTIQLSNLFASGLEYNLIYDAVVKKNQIQTGVTGSARLDNTSTYSNKQLLGSESSGKFTYHDSISNAVLELTLRDSNGYSIYSGTYPFTVSPGKTIDLSVSQ